MRKQIEEGKQYELASMRDAIPKDIATRQWLHAQADIARFEQLAAGDRRVAEWRKQMEAGLALDRSLDDLRASLRTAIREKDWAKAEAQIASLLAKAPDDPQAAAWRAQVAQGRKADLAVKKDSKQEEEHRMELARAEQLVQQGDYSAAIELFQRVLTQDRGNARARSGLKDAKALKALEDRVFDRDR
jgi:Flp pilus assembly protein TadD